MCGIAGFVDPAGDARLLRAMTDEIASRGPDDSGHFLENGVGLGHRRLSIIDLSQGGHQPMERDGLVMVFNGEIYNYREVRAELEGLGAKFHSASDSEVVLLAFRQWGPRCVERFIGMFAIALWDRSERSLYLIRDRVGVKPLCYYFRDGRLAFGSTLKALRPYLSPDERAGISSEALGRYFSFGYVGGELTILDSVRKLLPGHYLKLCDGRIETHRYWDVSFEPDPTWEARREEDLLDELEALVISSARYRMVADVPVGVFLSSGVDSALVSAVLSRNHGQINTFTIGFDAVGYDESADAARIAAELGSSHTQAVLSADKSVEIMRSFTSIYDEPFGDTSGVPTTFVSEIAKQAGMKVVLSGDGGDELFGGYTRYTEFLRRWHQSRGLGPLGRRAAAAGFRIAERFAGPSSEERFGRYADLLGHDEFVAFYQALMANSSRRQLNKLVPAFQEPTASAQAGDPLAVASEWDFKNYLPDDILVKVDRATMFNSIEGREPLLDQRLVEFGARLPTKFKIRNGETKYLLKRLLARYLPPQLFNLPKRGFGVPTGKWIEQFYRDRLFDVLGSDNLQHLDSTEVKSLLQRYRAGGPVNQPILWLLFTFQLWYDDWMASAPSSRRSFARVG